MNYIVVMQDENKAFKIKKLMELFAAGNIFISTDTKKAMEMSKMQDIKCVIFERKMASMLEDYFKLYRSNIWFVPVADEENYDDMKVAMNSGRMAYYLLAPFNEKKIKALLDCLDYKLKYRSLDI